jgi:arginyl-tRNA synthetase
VLRQDLLATLQAGLTVYLTQQGVALESLNGAGQLTLEIPKHRHFGDFAVNVSGLAKVLKMPPPKIAEGYVAALQDSNALVGIEASLAGGFVNFKLSDERLVDTLLATLKHPNVGQNEALKDTSALLEFVSANPTGPLHIGHGRWVALGDSLARVMTHCGATVAREFYINDAGSQIHNLAMSLWYRSLELLKTGVTMPLPVEGEKYPFYPGDYMIECAERFLATHAEDVKAWFAEASSPENPPEKALAVMKEFAMADNLAAQKALMSQCGLEFDRFFSEKTLYADDAGDKVSKTVEKLIASGYTYEEDGALWLKTTAFGDDQDRVLRKSSGDYTYFTPDLAYFEDKKARQNPSFNRFIYIWGADHHGYIPRMRAGIQALGYDIDEFEVILGQLVNLILDGEKTRMGKRKTMVTLSDLVEEVGVDPVRFWMIAKSADTAIDFDVDLAVSQSNENPVFYVQYAHARCASIVRNAMAPATNPDGPPWTPLEESDWQAFQQNVSPDALKALFEGLEHPDAPVALRELILRLDAFEYKVIDAAKNRSPHFIARYAQDLAADFHHFYTVCRILSPDMAVRKQRLAVVVAVQKTLAKALELLGVSAPESM